MAESDFPRPCIIGCASGFVEGQNVAVTHLCHRRASGSPAEFGKLIADETEKWGKVIRAALIRFLENLALEVHNAGIWNGLLISDMSQPHGGPMSTGHASHQIRLLAFPMRTRPARFGPRYSRFPSGDLFAARWYWDTTASVPMRSRFAVAAFINPASSVVLEYGFPGEI
jgi:hypothetical protein